MMYTITEIGDGTTRIAADFADEGVGLACETFVAGDEGNAIEYLPVFERDMRVNFRNLFPAEEPEVAEGGGE